MLLLLLLLLPHKMTSTDGAEAHLGRTEHGNTQATAVIDTPLSIPISKVSGHSSPLMPFVLRVGL